MNKLIYMLNLEAKGTLKNGTLDLKEFYKNQKENFE